MGAGQPVSSRAVIDAWLAVELIPGRRRTDALADLNEALHTAYALNRLSEWGNDPRTMPSTVRAYMLAIGIGALLRLHGIDPHQITDEQLDALAAALA